MTEKPPEIEELIRRAKGGEEDALNQLCTDYRQMLRLVAERAIGPEMARRTDASDLVQQTELEAFRAFASFQGSTEGEFVAWVKQILKRNVANVVRDNRAAKRDHRKEQYIHAASQSVSVTWLHPAERGKTPSQHVMYGEAALKLATAINNLPEKQRTAVRMRHLEGMALRDIAEAMESSPGAVAGLIRRGITALQAQMGSESQFI